jgi:hypothetical protein
MVLQRRCTFVLLVSDPEKLKELNFLEKIARSAGNLFVYAYNLSPGVCI